MDASPKPGRMRPLAVAAAAILFVTLVPLVAIELAARGYIAVKYGVPGKSYGLWTYDSEVGAIHRRNAYNTNAQTNDHGFRNAENVLNPKSPGALRIITYGGSTTFCYNLPDGETWPDRLEQSLRRDRHPRDQVLNAGAISWSVAHEFARARRDVPELKPDIAIIYTGVNETTNAAGLASQGISLRELVRQGRFGVPTTALDQGRWEKRNLAVVRVLDYFIQPFIHELMTPAAGARPAAIPAVAAPGQDKPDPDMLRNFEVTLERFVRHLREQGVRPVYVVMAHSGVHPHIASLVAYSRAGAPVALANGATVIDAQEVVKQYPGDPADLFIETGVHWSAKGAQLLAESIRRGL
jgi:lysophospholipase L1-like esterase